MELSKNDTKMTKGLAILFMVMLHMFCVKTDLPFTPLISIGSTPLVYYFGLFGDCCVVIYCFCSGYAHALMKEKKGKGFYPSIMKRLLVFLVNFWIVLIIFSAVGLITGSETIPGGFSDFIGTALLYSIKYNGAWWFVLTYALLCVLSPLILKLAEKSTLVTLAVLSVVYSLGYIYRFNVFELPQMEIFFFHHNLPCLATSLLPYAVGVLFWKHRVFTFLSNLFSRLKPWQGNLILAALFAAMFIMHCIIETLFVAIFTGIGTVIVFNLWKKPRVLTRLFEFFGNHSTNIWLTHMFFYLVLFENLVFIAKYPLPSFALMLAITVLVSLPINALMKLLKKTALKKLC